MNALTQYPIIAQVLLYVVAFNLLLSGAKAALDTLKGKSAALDKADSFLGTVITWIGKFLDMIGYNPQHLDK